MLWAPQADDSTVYARMYHAVLRGVERADYESINWEDEAMHDDEPQPPVKWVGLDYAEAMYNEEAKTLEMVASFGQRLYKGVHRALLKTQFKSSSVFITTFGSAWRQELENARRRLIIVPKTEGSGFKALCPIGRPPLPPPLRAEDLEPASKKAKLVPSEVLSVAPTQSVEQADDCAMEPVESAEPRMAKRKASTDLAAARIAELERELMERKAAAGLADVEREKLVQRIHTLGRDGALKTREIVELQNKNAQLESEIVELKKNVTASIGSVERSTTSNNELMDKHSSQSVIIAKLNAKIDQQTNEIRELHRTKDKTVDWLHDNIMLKDKMIQELHSDLRELRLDKDDTINKLHAELRLKDERLIEVLLRMQFQ